MDVVKELEFDKEVLKRIEMICRLGVITLDMKSAILSRIGKIKETSNELCHI